MKNLLSYFLTITLIIPTEFLFSQSIVTKFYSKDRKEALIDQAYYYEIQNNKLIEGDTVIAFYSSNGKLRSFSIVNQFGADNGAFFYFHENGQLKSKGIKRNGRPIGKIESYYPDGKTQAIEVFDPDNHLVSLITDYYDSLGGQMIKDGSGDCMCFFNAYSWHNFLEEGKLLNGKRNLVWVGFDPIIEQRFKEFYRKGSLRAGESYDSLGTIYTYTEIEENAEFKNGWDGLHRYISKELQYPPSARKWGIQGKVFIGFVVEKSGALSGLKVMKGIGFGCDDEALKVMITSSPWKPGKHRGQLVRQKMIYPVGFKVG